MSNKNILHLCLNRKACIGSKGYLRALNKNKNEIISVIKAYRII